MNQVTALFAAIADPTAAISARGRGNEATAPATAAGGGGGGGGGKARSLARLAAAGLPTPPGFVITDALFRALCPPLPPLLPPLDASGLQALADATAALDGHPWPDGFLAALEDHLRAIGDGDGARAPRFAVRSSFASEDRSGALAPGIYQSRVGVTAAEVPAAVREVLRSALGPGAAAYALAHGGTPAAPPVAVLIHRHLPGTAQGSAAREASPGSPPVMDLRQGEVTAAARATIAAALDTLARQHGPVEIEWVATGDAVTFLQLRPYQAPPPPRAWAGFADLPAPERPADWRWDAAHNPLPLSTCHAGLVAAVDGRCQIGIRQRVLGGYLYWRADDGALPRPGTLSPSAAPPPDLPALVAAITDEVDHYRETCARTPATLAATLEGFFPLYQRLFGELQPTARGARRALGDLLRACLPEPQVAAALPQLLREVPSHATLRAQLAARLISAPPHEQLPARAAYLAVFGDEAPRWDVAVPTYQEQSGRLGVIAAAALPFVPAHPSPTNVRDASEGAPTASTTAPPWQQTAGHIRAALPENHQDDFVRRLAAARLAVAAGEDDDWLYARLQRPVRTALLAHGQRLVAEGALDSADQIFHLPLQWLLAHERGEVPAAAARPLAQRGHAAEIAALADPPPVPADRGQPGPGVDRMVRGTGTAGRALGRVVHRHGPGGDHPPRDAILVATSLLPTELPLLQVAALVTETGGPLDHVAAQARERGLPAVVGAAGALTLLPEGQLVLVDAEAGLVVKCD